MKNILFYIIASFWLIIPPAFSQFAGGSGIAQDPYQVSSIEHLNNIRFNLDKHFVQTAHIDMINVTNWIPIGGGQLGNHADYSLLRFSGFYNGQGFEIRNLKIDRPDLPNIGLFGMIGHASGSNTTQPTVIRNVKLVNVDVKGARGTGSLVGRVHGNANTLIEYCYAINGSVVGDAVTGGLVGGNNSWRETPGGEDNPVVSQSFSVINVTRSSKAGVVDPIKYGGLVGCNQKGTIRNSYSRGDVTVLDRDRVGGLAGCIDIRGIVENSYSMGKVIGTEGRLVGGLIGNIAGTGGNNGIALRSFWDMQTSGMTTSAGGTGKTTAQMKARSTFVSMDWDFDDVWEMDDLLNEQPPAGNISLQSELERNISPNAMDVTNSVNDGYPYLQIIPNATQPIELLSFWAEDPGNGTLLLQWTTAREEDNDYFEILRSSNGLDFEILAQIDGAGNSSQILEYTFVDQRPLLGRNYYRLKQVDFDGTSTISRLISIRLNFGEHNQPFIYPNPNNGTTFFVVLPAAPGEYTFTMMDTHGRQVWRTTRNKVDYLNTLEFDMPERMNSGLFFLRIQGQDVNIVERVLVEQGR